jgi:hypothetical protein
MRAAAWLLRPLVFLLLAPGLVLAQGLGDVAARERQKREAAGHREKPRVLSNDDLQQKDPGNASTPAEASGTDPESEPSLRGDRDQRGSQEGAQRQTRLERAQAAVDAARAAVVAAEERVKAQGDKLNPMSPSFIYGGTHTGDAVGEEMRTREELKQAEAQLVEMRDALVKASQAYESARRARPSDSPDTR